MRRSRPKFNDFPAVVKSAMLLVFAAWVYFISYNIYISGTVSIYHLTMGMLVCFAIFSLKRWTRLFVFTYNLIMAVMIGVEIFYSVSSGGDFSLYGFSGKIISIVLFSVSSVVLLSAGVKSFFAQNS